MSVETLGRAREHIPNSISHGGAHRMAERLQRYWHVRGYARVRFWVESTGNSHAIRSNLVDGYPPTKGEDTA